MSPPLLLRVSQEREGMRWTNPLPEILWKVKWNDNGNLAKVQPVRNVTVCFVQTLACIVFSAAWISAKGTVRNRLRWFHCQPNAHVKGCCTMGVPLLRWLFVKRAARRKIQMHPCFSVLKVLQKQNTPQKLRSNNVGWHPNRQKSRPRNLEHSVQIISSLKISHFYETKLNAWFRS